MAAAAAPQTAPAPQGVALSAAPERSAAADRAAEKFEESFGYAPDGVWSAPGRVNIIGEHVAEPIPAPSAACLAVRPTR